MPMTLTPDAQVPALTLPTVGGGTFDLSAQTPQAFTMVVFYRGLHCPLCKAYLATLNGLMPGYRDAGFSVVAASMDPADRAKTAKAEWDVADVDLAYGLDEETAREWGLYISQSINEKENTIFCEPGLFWVRPDGRLYLADVSNMPFARPDLEALLSKTGMIAERDYPARGTKAAA